MKTDLARIRELEAGLKPLRDANWLCDMAVALEALHAERGGHGPGRPAAGRVA